MSEIKHENTQPKKEKWYSSSRMHRLARATTFEAAAVFSSLSSMFTNFPATSKVLALGSFFGSALYSITKVEEMRSSVVSLCKKIKQQRADIYKLKGHVNKKRPLLIGNEDLKAKITNTKLEKDFNTIFKYYLAESNKLTKQIPKNKNMGSGKYLSDHANTVGQVLAIGINCLTTFVSMKSIEITLEENLTINPLELLAPIILVASHVKNARTLRNLINSLENTSDTLKQIDSDLTTLNTQYAEKALEIYVEHITNQNSTIINLRLTIQENQNQNDEKKYDNPKPSVSNQRNANTIQGNLQNRTSGTFNTTTNGFNTNLVKDESNYNNNQ